MNQRLLLKFHMFFVSIASIVSFSGAIMHAAQVEVKEAADVVPNKTIIPEPPIAPSKEQVKQETKQSQLVSSFVSRLIKEAARPIPEEPHIQPAQEEETKEAEEENDTQALNDLSPWMAQKFKENELALRQLQLDQGIDPNTRSLLVFLDDSEIVEKNSAMTITALIALEQKAGPILISGALLSNIFNIDNNHNEETKKILPLFYTNFDARQWTIYRLNTFFLLIPQKGLWRVSDFNKEDTWIEIAYKNKNFLQEYFIADNKKEYEYFKHKANNPKLAHDFLTVFKELFLQKPKNREKFNWIIYLIGHGDYGKSIAGFSINGEKSEFKQLLDFLDKKIKTKLFVYMSCYAAGFNAKQIYGELQYSADKGEQLQQPVIFEKAHARQTQDIRTYPFTIVTGATTDAVTSANLLLIDYDTFIKETQKESINYPVALSYLFPLINQPAISNQAITTIPQIRPANSPAWFPLVDYNKAVIRIGKVMAYTKEKNKNSLVIKQYKDAQGNMHDPKAILLATDNVPFAIEIDENIQHIPPVISLISGEATHTLKLVIPKKHSLADFIKKTGSVDYGVQKTFIININDNLKYIETKNGVFNLDGNTPLHKAARNGQIGAAQKLIKQKAMINIQNNVGNTPLHNAAERLIEQEGDENYFNQAKHVIQLLIDAQADTTIKNIDGKTAIDMLKDADDMCACARTIDEAFLFKGAVDGNAAMVQKALDSGVKPNTMLTMPLGSESDIERTALHIAADQVSTKNDGHAEVIRILIERGADINKKDSNGNTPLHKAIERLIKEKGDEAHSNKAKNVIQLLIDAKADTTIKNNNEKTALDMLREAGIDSAKIIREINKE